MGTNEESDMGTVRQNAKIQLEYAIPTPITNPYRHEMGVGGGMIGESK